MMYILKDAIKNSLNNKQRRLNVAVARDETRLEVFPKSSFRRWRLGQLFRWKKFHRYPMRKRHRFDIEVGLHDESDEFRWKPIIGQGNAEHQLLLGTVYKLLIASSSDGRIIGSIVHALILCILPLFYHAFMLKIKIKVWQKIYSGIFGVLILNSAFNFGK